MAEPRKPSKAHRDDLWARIFGTTIDAAAVLVMGLFFAVILFGVLFTAAPELGDRLAAWLELDGQTGGDRLAPVLAILGWFALTQALHYGLGWRSYRSSLGMRMNRVVLQHARGGARRPHAPGVRYLVEVVLPGVLLVDGLLVVVYFML